MTKETIYNNYAIKQGYGSWDNLVNEKINEQRLSLYYDFNAIIDLIQDELKKKIIESDLDVVFDDLEDLKSRILDTENIK